MLSDLRFSLRNFRKSPGFVAIAILILALGIGANTAIFSVVSGALLHGLPYPAADRIVMVWERNPLLGDFIAERVPVCLANFFVWRNQAKSFEEFAVYENQTFTLTGGHQAEQVEGARTSANLPALFGLRPAFGRVYTDQEGEPGANRVAVINHALFKQRFGARSDTLGSVLRLGRIDYKIIGVWPAGFHMPGMYEGMDQKKPRIWIPLDMRENRPDKVLRDRNYYIYARLRPGVTVQQARAEMAVISSQTEAAHPEYNKGFSTNVWPLSSEDVGPKMRSYVLLLQGAVGFVLLIACANVANLMLARTIGRRKELAVRLALGATRWSVMRQLFTESLLLSCTAGAAGVLLALWGIRVIDSLAPSDSSHLHDLSIDPWTLVFTMLVALLTGVLFGLAPAIDAACRNVNEALTQGGRAGSAGISGRYRGVLVAGEVALALMLLVGAGLLIRTVQALVSTDQGFRRDHLLTVTLHLPEAKYPKRQQYADFSRQLLDRTAALPGVTSASLASGLPMQNLQVQSYGIDGAPRPEPPPMTDVRTVDENYFRTMGIPVTLGRNFTRQETDDEKSSVIIINQAMAKKIAAGQDPLSKRLSMHDRKWEVIGVVGDASQLGPETPINPEVYFPSRAYREMTMVVRTTLEPTQLASPISRAVSAIDNEQPVSETATMEEALKGWTGEKRFVMVLLATFAALALLLAAAGIYGVLAYSVSQRTREIGIRMAIGATAGDVLKMIVREGFILTAIGLAIGLAGAFALTRLLQGLVFGVSTTDAASFIGAIAVLGIASLAASWLPARRAAKLEPLTALRDE